MNKCNILNYLEDYSARNGLAETRRIVKIFLKGRKSLKSNLFLYLETAHKIARNDVLAACKRFLYRGDRSGAIPEKRRSIPKKWTLSALEKQGGRCKRCNRELNPKWATGDHTIALSLGGEHSEENITAFCRSCNSKKGSRSVLKESKSTGKLITEMIK